MKNIVNKSHLLQIAMMKNISKSFNKQISTNQKNVKLINTLVRIRLKTNLKRENLTSKLKKRKFINNYKKRNRLNIIIKFQLRKLLMEKNKQTYFKFRFKLYMI